MPKPEVKSKERCFSRIDERASGGGMTSEKIVDSAAALS